MPPNGSSARCPDWVWSNGSNVHVTKDREWFTEYIPFKTHLSDIYGMLKDPIQVLGIGTVEIPTKRSSGRGGKGNQGTLRLTNVLYAPDSICNIIGQPISDNYTITLEARATTTKSSSGTITDKQGNPVAYFDGNCPLFQIKLHNPPGCPRVLQPRESYRINVHWDASEAARWKNHQAMPSSSRELYGYGYTWEEHQWLKKHYKSEFYFLRDNGLSIYRDEDRECGRRIVRMMMRPEIEERCTYTPEEKKWMKNHYGGEFHFLRCHGLNIHDDEDREEGRSILHAFMYEGNSQVKKTQSAPRVLAQSGFCTLVTYSPDGKLRYM
ncbi:hypothetical protein FQN54_002168 [Arachnomyces sp. PD_36]|nr:hypothetical protein FQN54_002168 [Arachnomyces sp. PD_36]